MVKDIRQNEEFYDELPCGFFVTSLQGNIQQWNETLLGWLGYTRKSPDENIRFHDLLSMGSQIYFETHYFPLLKAQGSVEEVKLVFQKKDGTRFSALVTTRQSKSSEGHYNTVVFKITQRDLYEKELLAERKRAEELVKALEKVNKDLEQFAFVASHDLKSPLANIVSIIDLINHDYKGRLDDQLVDYLNLVMQSSTRLHKLIDGILDYYKNSTMILANPVLFDLRELLHEIINLVVYDDSIQVRLNVPSQKILSYRAPLEQIFINLVSNAVKYNESEPAEIEIFFEEKPGSYFFSVKDNGKQIDKKDHKTIFNLFSNLGKNDKAGNQGPGMGLATVKSLVESLGGSINVVSDNSGNSFEFDIQKQASLTRLEFDEF